MAKSMTTYFLKTSGNTGRYEELYSASESHIVTIEKFNLMKTDRVLDTGATPFTIGDRQSVGCSAISIKS